MEADGLRTPTCLCLGHNFQAESWHSLGAIDPFPSLPFGLLGWARTSAAQLKGGQAAR